MSGITRQLLSINHLGVPLKPSEAPAKTKQIGTKGVVKTVDVQVAKAKPKKRGKKSTSKKQNPAVTIGGDVAELITRGQQLLEELDKAHTKMQEAAEEALSPDPQAWRCVRAAMTSYTANYAELIQLSKQLNRLVAQGRPELIQLPTPPKPSTFGEEGP